MSWDIEFKFPLCLEDLQKSHADDRYTVGHVYGVYELPSKLQECERDQRFEGPVFILSHFDTLYSFLTNFHQLDAAVIARAWSTVSPGVTRLTNDLALLLEDSVLDYEARVKNLNILKMITFAHCKMSEMLESKYGQADMESVLTLGKGKKKTKQVNAGVALDWDNQKSVGALSLYQLLQLPLHRLWDPPVIEQGFVELVSNCCYKLMESTSFAYARVKSYRRSVLQILGTLVKNYKHGQTCCLKVVQMLGLFDHLVCPLAELVVIVALEYGQKGMVTQVVREIGQTDTRQLDKGSGMTRSYGLFMVELAKQIPHSVLPSINLLLHLLEEDSYAMRNCVLGMLGEMVLQVLSKTDADDNERKCRDEFITHLIDHGSDVHSFVRSKVLQIFQNLVADRKVPTQFWNDVLQLAADRLMDKTSSVRKSALRLLSELLHRNSLLANKTDEELEADVKAQTEVLKKMIQDESSQRMGNIEPWEVIEEDVRKCIEEIGNRGLEDISDSLKIVFDDGVIPVIDKTFQHLRQRQFQEAVTIAKQMASIWPDFRQLKKASEEKDDEEDEDMEDSEDDDDEDGKKIEQQESEDDLILTFLKNIYRDEMVKRAEAEYDGTNEQQDESELVKTNRQLLEYIIESRRFLVIMSECIPTVYALLTSKQPSDVLEAVDLFVVAVNAGVLAAQVGVRKMLLLVWSKDDNIKQALVQAYKRLYVERPGEDPNKKGKKDPEDPRLRALRIVGNFIELVKGASHSELACLEKLMCEFVKSGDIGHSCFKVMWERFQRSLPKTSQQDARAALILLRMCAGAEPGLIRTNLATLVTLGLSSEADLDLVKNSCMALIRMIPPKPSSEDLNPPLRFLNNHEIFVQLKTILVNNLFLKEKSSYVPMAAKAIDAIYGLAEQPNKICEQIVYSVTAGLKSRHEEAGYCVTCVSRFLFLIGHISACFLHHMEVRVVVEMKRRENVKELKAGRPSRGRASAASRASVSFNRSKVKAGSSDEDDAIVGASAEDVQSDFVNNILDNQVLTPNNLLGLFRPMLVELCRNPGKYPSKQLWVSAGTALAKFMLLSSYCCEENLSLLFTILEKAPCAVVRSNITVALRDLTMRHPNMLAAWTPKMYARLHDPTPMVRMNALCVLTHLILSDMIKVKGHIADIAGCMVSKEPAMADVSQTFFKELAQRANALYNVMPDIISRLSAEDTGVAEEHFRTIMKILIGLITEEKQVESLVEKLCQRFKTTQLQRHWRDIAFCLSCFSYSIRSIRKLQDNMNCFADKLHEDQVHECIASIITTTRKAGKADIKSLLDELEKSINDSREKDVEDAAMTNRAELSAARKSRPLKTPARHNKAPRGAVSTKKRATRRRERSPHSSDDDFMSDASIASSTSKHGKGDKSDSESGTLDPPKSKKTRSARPTKTKSRTKEAQPLPTPRRSARKAARRYENKENTFAGLDEEEEQISEDSSGD